MTAAAQEDVEVLGHRSDGTRGGVARLLNAVLRLGPTGRLGSQQLGAVAARRVVAVAADGVHLGRSLVVSARLEWNCSGNREEVTALGSSKWLSQMTEYRTTMWAKGLGAENDMFGQQ